MLAGVQLTPPRALFLCFETHRSVCDRFGSGQPRYFEVLKALHRYHQGAINVTNLLLRMSEICRGHADLLEQFCTFIPVEVDLTSAVRRTAQPHRPSPAPMSTPPVSQPAVNMQPAVADAFQDVVAAPSAQGTTAPQAPLRIIVPS